MRRWQGGEGRGTGGLGGEHKRQYPTTPTTSDPSAGSTGTAGSGQRAADSGEGTKDTGQKDMT